MLPEGKETVGTYLKRNRELKGIGLEEIASVTKINIGILSHLENDRLDKLPAPIFVKGFIKAYLKHLGIDSKEAIQSYDLMCSSLEEIEEQPVDKISEREGIKITKISKLKFNRKTIVISSVVLVVITSFLIYQFFFKTSVEVEKGGDVKSDMIVKIETSQKRPKKNVVKSEILEESKLAEAGGKSEAKMDKEVKEEVKEEAKEEPPKEAKKEVVEKGTKQRVVINAKKKVWVKVELDKMKPFHFVLDTGDKRVLRADREIKVLVGDASAVVINYGDKKMKSLGKPGAVRTIVFPGLGRWENALQ